MAPELFSPSQELQILSELTRLGYVAECTPRNATTRGHWVVELEPPQPCIMVCPTIWSSADHDDTGEVALMIFPDGHRVIHCGLSGMIDRLDHTLSLEAVVLRAEQLAAGVL